jgi:hypothetical protein
MGHSAVKIEIEGDEEINHLIERAIQIPQWTYACPSSNQPPTPRLPHRYPRSDRPAVRRPLPPVPHTPVSLVHRGSSNRTPPRYGVRSTRFLSACRRPLRHLGRIAKVRLRCLHHLDCRRSRLYDRHQGLSHHEVHLVRAVIWHPRKPCSPPPPGHLSTLRRDCAAASQLSKGCNRHPVSCETSLGAHQESPSIKHSARLIPP